MSETADLAQGVQSAQRVQREPVTCAYGRASVVFPLSVSAAPALALLEATSQLPAWPAQVQGYTTSLTSEAGACSVRMVLKSLATDLEQGNYAVALQAAGFPGWIPGLGNTRKLDDGRMGLEVVVLGRADSKHAAVTYLAEDTLAAFLPLSEGLSEARVRVLQPRLMKQLADCPGQWLRDRLLKLANCVEEAYGAADSEAGASARLREELLSAGLVFVPAGEEKVSHADKGQRISAAELGYWQEEADIGHRCAGSMDGFLAEFLAAMGRHVTITDVVRVCMCVCVCARFCVTLTYLSSGILLCMCGRW